MQKWEYKIVSDASEQDLDKLGLEGWELVAAAYNPHSLNSYCYLKRKKS
jgi:hypothetical protein